jgi:hypothetical protein
MSLIGPIGFHDAPHYKIDRLGFNPASDDKDLPKAHFLHHLLIVKNDFDLRIINQSGL